MDSCKLLYNTERERLNMPEYGRNVQKMVEYLEGIEDRDKRNEQARAVVKVMEILNPQVYLQENYEQKLWDHLAIMSGFKLDIDYPVDVSNARQILQKPQPMSYPMSKIPIRHYGKILFELFDKLKTMEPGKERDDLVGYTANQMKRDLLMWSHGSSDDEKVADDLYRFTDGKIRLDLSTFKFERINMKDLKENKKKKK